MGFCSLWGWAVYMESLFLSTQPVRAQLCSQEGAGDGGPPAEAQTGKIPPLDLLVCPRGAKKTFLKELTDQHLKMRRCHVQNQISRFSQKTKIWQSEHASCMPTVAACLDAGELSNKP